MSSRKGPAVEDDDLKSVVAWAEDEFDSIAADAADNTQTYQVAISYAPPSRPRTGMLAYADGVKWNPGLGEGLYTYGSDGVWHLTSPAAPIDALAYSGLQINGSFEISQELASNAVNIGTLNTYIVDNWAAAKAGTMVCSGVQVSDAPPGFSNSIKITVSTAQAVLGAGDYLLISQAIEGFRISRLAFGFASAAPVTIGFYTKIHRPGVYSGSLLNAAHTRAFPFTFTQNVADTWEFKRITIPGDQGGSWVGNSSAQAMHLYIAMACGTTFSGAPGVWTAANLVAATGTTNGVAATSDVFQMTAAIILPGLELPPVSRLPFVMRSLDQELSTCMQYFEKSTNYETPVKAANDANFILIVNANPPNGSYYGSPIWFKVKKRIPPTVIIYPYTTPTNTGRVSNDTGVDYGAASGNTPVISQNNFFIENQSGAGMVIGSQFIVIFGWYADARF